MRGGLTSTAGRAAVALAMGAIALPLAQVGCEPAAVQFPREVEVDGRVLKRHSVDRVTIGVLAVYAPPNDHPTTADLTVGLLRSHLPVQQMVSRLRLAHEQSAATRMYREVPFETGDAVRFQTCRVYLDEIGQPVIAWEVAERLTSESSVGTSIVRELDNREEAQNGYRVCRDRRGMLGPVWALHRQLFPVKN